MTVIPTDVVTPNASAAPAQHPGPCGVTKPLRGRPKVGQLEAIFETTIDFSLATWQGGKAIQIRTIATIIPAIGVFQI